jgi:hypothetical protein
MSQEIFNQQYLNQQTFILVVQLLTFLAAFYFAWLQYKINDRLRKLEDYVATSIVPDPQGKLALQFVNVGKVNLYLKKYEIGNLVVTFNKEVLLVCGTGNPNFFVNLPATFIAGMEMPVKLYLSDEFGQKYISEGAVVIDVVSVNAPQTQQPVLSPAPITPSQQSPQPQVLVGPRAWSYKTEKRKWII